MMMAYNQDLVSFSFHASRTSICDRSCSSISISCRLQQPAISSAGRAI
jgi:hypothetical protein